jgi:hypothetical protein
MYAQHQRLRDTMMSSPYQSAANGSPAAPPSRRQGSSVGDWNVSSPAYRDLGVVSSDNAVDNVRHAARASHVLPGAHR